MITLNIKQDIQRAITGLSDFEKTQVPYATALALNAVAEIAKQTIKTKMSVFFDRPTAYTLNSLGVQRATKTNLFAIVGSFGAREGKTPASAYLKYEILGGNRAEKSTEKAAGSIFVPTKAATLNQYGNLPANVVSAIRSAIASGTGSVVIGNLKYIVMRPGNPRGLTPGVYVSRATLLKTKISGRKGSKVAETQGMGPLKPLVFFEPKATYKQRYDIEGIVKPIVQANFAREFENAIAYAMSTKK